MHMPATQPSRSLVHAWQALPPAPQAVRAVPGSHTPELQQPSVHVAGEHGSGPASEARPPSRDEDSLGCTCPPQWRIEISVNATMTRIPDARERGSGMGSVFDP